MRLLRSLGTTKGRREANLFLVEGVRSIEDGLKSGVTPHIALYNSELLARTPRGNNLYAELSRLLQTGIMEGSERALKAAADTEHPQGIVAAFPLPEFPPTVEHEGLALVLVCDGISDPGNMGTLLRSAEAAGAHLVLAAQGCVDVFNTKVVRAAMGAHFRLPISQDLTWEQIAERLGANGVAPHTVYCTDADADRVYDKVDWQRGAALVVSNEAHGLSSEASELCSQGGGSIGIPMLGGTESLNAAVAGSIILFEAARQRRAKSHG